MQGAVDVGRVVQIAAAIAALEEDAFDRVARFEAEGVDGFRRDLEGQVRRSRFFGWGFCRFLAGASVASPAGRCRRLRRLVHRR